MNFNLKDKKVLITGATRGIGYSIASSFVKEGAKVTITGRKNINRFNTDLEIEDYIQLDSKNSQSTISFFSTIKKMRAFDILINNLGINQIDFICNVKSKNFKEILFTNLELPFELSKIVANRMIKVKKGKILNISSIWGIVTKENRTSYSVSKSALNGLTRSLSIDLAKYNILVNSLSPGIVNTDLTNKILGSQVNKIKSQIPLKRLAETKDISPLALFLTSDLNNYITGQNIVIDGGYTAV